MNTEFLHDMWIGLTAPFTAAVGSILFSMFVYTTVRVRRWFKRNTLSYQASRSIYVQEVLSKLRYETGADRVGVMQFINGAHFLNKVSKYNLMCTHQSIKAGIAAISLSTDESVLTQFPKFMKQMLAGSCVKFNIEDVPDSVMKAAMERQGVVCMAAAPFFSRGGDIEGFLIVDHVHEGPGDLCNDHCEKIEHTAAQIGFELRR